MSCAVGQYDKNEAKQHQTRRTLSQPDSDGWVTVARRRPFPVCEYEFNISVC